MHGGWSCERSDFTSFASLPMATSSGAFFFEGYIFSSPDDDYTEGA